MEMKKILIALNRIFENYPHVVFLLIAQFQGIFRLRGELFLAEFLQLLHGTTVKPKNT